VRARKGDARLWVLFATALLCAFPYLGRAHQDPADYRLVVLGHFDAEALAAFNKRVQEYAALRTRLEVGLPPLTITENPDEIERFERRLTSRLRNARGSRGRQVFTRAMEAQIKRLLASQADPDTLAAIADDGPADFDVDINATYSKNRPLATMPVKILLLLPELPPEVEYRFVGRHLILRDVRANMIIDKIRHALP
jgi:hypothetical protein